MARMALQNSLRQCEWAQLSDPGSHPPALAAFTCESLGLFSSESNSPGKEGVRDVLSAEHAPRV